MKCLRFDIRRTFSRYLTGELSERERLSELKIIYHNWYEVHPVLNIEVVKH